MRKAIGIDFGCSSFITLSSGHAVSYPEKLRKARKEIDRTAGKLRRHGVTRTERARLKARLAQLKDRFQAMTHKFIDDIIKWLVRDWDVFCVEDINKERLLRSGGAPKSTNRMPWKRFTEQLRSACRKKKKEFVMVPAANTSRLCSQCGNLKERLWLSERTYFCENPKCKLSMNRDINAAINILNRGRELLYGA